MFLVLVADHNLPLLLEALGSVNAELARIHYAVRDFAAWPAPESPDLLRTRAAIRRAFEALRAMRALLVAEADRSVETRASALRARGIVVSLQLVELRHADVGKLLAAAGTSVEAFTAYLLAQVGRANTLWVGRSDDEAALERAELAFDGIGRDPLVASVLAHGKASRDAHLRARAPRSRRYWMSDPHRAPCRYSRVAPPTRSAEMPLKGAAFCGRGSSIFSAGRGRRGLIIGDGRRRCRFGGQDVSRE